MGGLEDSPARKPVRLAAGAAEVVFEWRGDRWGHRVRVVSPAAAGFQAESVDESASAEGQRWPASPVFTELVPAAAGSAAGVLAVGAAGRSHFSLALTPDPSRTDTLLFEVACRVQEPPGPLGTTYRIGRDRAAPASRLRVEPTGPRCGETGPSPPRTIRWSYAIGPAGILPGRDSRCLVPAEA